MTERIQIMGRELPERLFVTDDFEIAENIGSGSLLLMPATGYPKDKRIRLERIIKEIVRRYNNVDDAGAGSKKTMCVTLDCIRCSTQARDCSDRFCPIRAANSGYGI